MTASLDCMVLDLVTETGRKRLRTATIAQTQV